MYKNYRNTPIHLEKVKQGNKEFYTGKILFSDFENTYTTSPAEYKKSIYQEKINTDERYIDLLEDIEKYLKTQKSDIKSGFQRSIDESRTEEIKNYIMYDEFGIIPNSIIVNVDCTEIQNIDELNKLDEDDEHKAVLFGNDLYIPNFKRVFLIIDGQHRIYGCKKLPEEIKAEMELLITFIINADSKVQAQLFTTINYKVKPVNKSYLYHILGEFGIGDSEETYLHEFIKLLNELKTSPLLDRVKMLGKSDKDKKGSLSQAFLAESLYLLISPKYREVRPLMDIEEVLRIPVFRYHFLNNKYRNNIPKFIIIYLKVIQQIYMNNSNNWDDKDNNIFLKTVGMGGLIDLLSNLYILYICKIDKLNNQYEIDFLNLEEDLNTILSPLKENIIFKDLKNEFAKGSSRGAIKKLTKQLWQTILLDNSNFDKYQKEYISWFNQTMIFK